jgi:hypothetical protein
MVGIKGWQYGADKILSDLSRRFLNRDKFKLIWEARSLEEELNPRKRQKVRDYFERLSPGSAEYYFLEDSIGTLPYDPQEGVRLLMEDGSLRDLARHSNIIRDITHKLVRARYYAPAEHAVRILPMLR